MDPNPRTFPDASAFGASVPYQLGLEEELLLVDSAGQLIPRAKEVLERVSPETGLITAEISQTMIELVSPVCTHAVEAVDAIAALREQVAATDALFIGAGLHPTAAPGETFPTPNERYEEVLDNLRSFMTQTPYTGTHIHVGMPDAETAMSAFNGMRKWLPVLIALGANSAFRHGEDTGFASARTAMYRAFPRSGAPRHFADYADYRQSVEDVVEGGGLIDMRQIWWDMRLCAKYGTVEVRAPDTQSSLDNLQAIAGLCHGLLIHESQRRGGDEPAPELLDELCFVALRDGLDAEILFEGQTRPMQDLASAAAELAARSAPYDPRDDVAALLARGNGADMQRADFARGGVPALLTALIRRSAAPVERA